MQDLPTDFGAILRALVHRSATHAKLARFEAAVEDADSALGLDSGYAPAYFRKGVAAFQLGNLADAEVALTRAARLDPSLPVKKWLRKLRAEVAALLGETPVPPPPPPSVPPPPPGSDAAITEYLSRSLQDVGTASEYLSRSMQDVGTLALAQLRMLGQEKDEAVEAKAKAVEAAEIDGMALTKAVTDGMALSEALQKANKDYVVAERTHAAEMAKLVAQTTAKRKATADVGTSTGSLPYYIAARKRRR